MIARISLNLNMIGCLLKLYKIIVTKKWKNENDFEGLAEMAPRLISDKIIDDHEANNIYTAAFTQKLASLTKTNEALALRKLLPKKVRYILPINTQLLLKIDEFKRH